MADDSVHLIASDIKSDSGADDPSVTELEWKREKKRAQKAAYYQANKEVIKERSAAQRANNGDKLRAQNKAWRLANKDRLRISRREWCAANKDHVRNYRMNESYQEKRRARGTKWYAANKEKVKAQSAARYAANKDERSAYSKAWRIANKERIRSYRATDHYKGMKRGWDATYYAANSKKMNARMKEYYIANKDKILAHNAKWKAKHPDKENPARLAYLQAWWAANIDKRRAYQARGRVTRREKIVAWRKANKALISTYSARRRARQASVPGSFTQTEVKTLFLKQRKRCAYNGKHVDCLGIITLANGKKNTLQCDHIIPLALPGSTNFISNIQLLCGPCNFRKNASDPIDFARRLGLLL